MGSHQNGIRGLILLDWIAEHKIIQNNNRNNHTLVRRESKSHVELTMYSENMAN